MSVTLFLHNNYYTAVSRQNAKRTNTNTKIQYFNIKLFYIPIYL